MYLQHRFSVEIASKFGVKTAVFLEHLIFCTQRNSQEGTKFHNGRYWTYGSPRSFAKDLPFLKESSIRYIIKKLLSDGLIMREMLNADTRDRTLSYALSDKLLNTIGLDKTCNNPRGDKNDKA